VLDEHVVFLERAGIEQDFETLAGGQLAALVLRVDARLAAAQTSLAADVLFQIGPFAPNDTVADLPALLTLWLSGASLSGCDDPAAVGFIQEHIVYRLVWAVEASRLHLQHLRNSSEEPPGNVLALCLTYGVPSVKAALLMQGGIRSRIVAVSASGQIAEEITDLKVLTAWVRRLRKGEVKAPGWTSDNQQKEWDRFIASFGHHHWQRRMQKSFVVKVSWHSGSPPKPKSVVRVTRTSGETAALVSSVSSLPLGTTTIPRRIQGNHFTGRVSSISGNVRVRARVGSS